MTAEIALMNRHAVALAADSAVTIGGASVGSHGPKIFNSVNKLFSLSRRAPVGLMIYGNAMIAGLPWETVVKEYRRELGDYRFDHIEEYADDFINYLDGNTDLFPEAEQQRDVRAAAFSYFMFLLDEVKSKIHEHIQSHGQITKRETRQIVRTEVRAHLAVFDKRRNLPGRTKRYSDRVSTRYRTEIEAVVDEVFEDLPISQAVRTDLRQIVGSLYRKDAFPSNGLAGIVIAGFGEAEYTPALVGFDVFGVAADRIKYRQHDLVAIDSENNACLIPFAQSEMVKLFMDGIDPMYRSVIDTMVADLLHDLPDVVAGSVPPVTEAHRNALADVLKKVNAQFADRLNQLQRIEHVLPIVNSIAHLPKDELAQMAETLVNLTSFKRRVTLSPETVGGPIDVAVISKGDGFIWIDRKHYFDAEKNHQFFSNYYSN